MAVRTAIVVAAMFVAVVMQCGMIYGDNTSSPPPYHLRPPGVLTQRILALHQGIR